MSSAETWPEVAYRKPVPCALILKAERAYADPVHKEIGKRNCRREEGSMVVKPEVTETRI